MNDDTNQLPALGYKIFLDRYAVKDTTKETLGVGDLVLVNTNLETGQKEVGTVTAVNAAEKKATIQLADGSGIVERAYEHVDKPLETQPSQMLERVAKGAASIETTAEKKAEWQEKFRWLLEGYKFVPAGRILAAAGTDQKLTYYNCYVIPSPKDSREGIFGSLARMAEIFSRGGGVGINISTLRPRYAYVKGVNGRSSGSVSWGSLFSYVTGLIEQGGSRRGALMLILNDWHPDVEEFITSKSVAGKIENANISIGVSDEFMRAVEEDADWQLEFPDTRHEQYNEEWKGILEDWKAKGYPTVVHKTVKAREIWDKIITSAWASAEPGIWFRGRSNQDSNSYYYQPLICTNPCGEQPLPEWSVCNLGAINLAKFVDEDRQDVAWEDLKTAVRYAVRLLDNVIDLTPYFFEENEKQQKGERRVGLNTMGIAELMIRLGITYGSEESLKFIDKLYEVIRRESYLTSADLAAEKGSFTHFVTEKFLDSGYARRLPDDVKEAIRQKGMRNVTLLTQAPNGTIGTMVGTSTGIEPYYNWTYFRKSRLGLHEEEVAVVKEWKEKHPGETLPKFFVNAMELSPEQHITVQGRIQQYVDSAISKTCNVPQDYTVEQVKKLYVLMHHLGCKGGTIYRDKSRDEQILMNKDDSRAQQEQEANQAVVAAEQAAVASLVPADTLEEAEAPTYNPSDIVRERNHRTHGVTVAKDTPMGKAYITLNMDTENEPIEVFTRVGKAGSDINAMTDAMGRLISLVLRLRSAVPPKMKVAEIVRQLRGIGGAESRGFGRNRILSVPDAVAIAMSEEYLEEAADTPPADHPTTETGNLFNNPTPADLCPKCGNTTFIRQEGCQTCATCGHSKC